MGALLKSPAIKWIKEHQFTSIVMGLYIFFQVGAMALPEGDLKSMFQGHADDTYGAMLAVVGLNALMERKDRRSEMKPWTIFLIIVAVIIVARILIQGW